MIRICPEPESLTFSAAWIFASEAKRAVTAHGRFRVLLSACETMLRVYRQLCTPPFSELIPWQQVEIFSADERCIPGTCRSAIPSWFCAEGKDARAGARVHPILGDEDPERAAAAYEQVLKDSCVSGLPLFDLVMLGMQDDGTIASLMPESPALEETQRWTAAARRPVEDFQRITVTVPVINQGALVVLVVSGVSRAAALRQALQQHDGPCVPARRIRPASGKLLWLVDHGAFSGEEVHQRTGPAIADPAGWGGGHDQL